MLLSLLYDIREAPYFKHMFFSIFELQACEMLKSEHAEIRLHIQQSHLARDRCGHPARFGLLGQIWQPGQIWPSSQIWLARPELATRLDLAKYENMTRFWPGLGPDTICSATRDISKSCCYITLTNNMTDSHTSNIVTYRLWRQ